ncbi:hypothetical protein [Bacteroides helcogenes]|uniref:Uncharacterized protein n=1 Tax=Bacteroides helcogenes (strain ATCC 35417 / DSM 20613 / JCM 6297 / CCUG 15421 / P 36-108) TaxID=693979 RepID=E6SUP4_BACT6|nr:hypothetical protein [Bacteroides helcogenes]ADV44389.1 hypothetical protein Bache_2423 [Bacteroides helcogenes P 36-108]
MRKKRLRASQQRLKLTKEEEELIRCIRNYQNSFPNGYPQLLWYCQELFDKLVDLPRD